MLYAQARKLDDLVDVTDNEIILKCSLIIPVLGVGQITLKKGTVIKIGE